MTMLINLPHELLTKIICTLPIKSFNRINTTCQEIYCLKLNQYLVPIGISGVPNITNITNPNTIYQDVKIDQQLCRQRGPLYCMYDMIAQLERMQNMYTVHDFNDVNQHDYIFRLLFYTEYYVYLSSNSLRTIHRKILKLDNIDSIYHKDILSSKLLSGLI